MEYIITATVLLTMACRSNAFHGTPTEFFKIRSATGPRRINKSPSFPLQALYGSSSRPENVAIVGGGLAGLSACYQLLQKTLSTSGGVPNITIIDKAEPGVGGASSKAGGLLHPFSPRGKALHLGMEGLEITNRLVAAALQFDACCVLREKMYRIALHEKSRKDLRGTASRYPDHASWLSSEQVLGECGTSHSLGGVRLHNGCKIIHVPSYLRGLWGACRDLSGDTAQWSIEDPTCWKDRLEEFDTVILSAGAGLFQDGIYQDGVKGFPAEIVRGQSVELKVNCGSSGFVNEAFLCGKYVVPLPGKDRVLVGSTHEYTAEALKANTVVEELRNKSVSLSPSAWTHGQVEKVTSGLRLQSHRGQNGRMPIIGRPHSLHLHPNTWLFTGLSGRGLIYHGIFGDILTDAILRGDEEDMERLYPDTMWWKSKITQS